ncbi:MAG: phosphotransferase [Anaerolineales bacterium]|nr:phosphotransferase [Anaerolineales bacterium]
MIPVPQPVLRTLAEAFGASAESLSHFGGGQEASDGTLYTYPYGDKRRLLKIMAIPVEDQRIGLLCFEERLRFLRFLGDHGAHIVFPQYSPPGNLYETCTRENHIWVAYSMELAPGKHRHEKTWDSDFFRNWGQTVGKLHHLAQDYPSWQALSNPETGKDLLTWRREWESFHSWMQDEEVKAQWVALKQQLETLPVVRDSFGFIHNDPHIWNLLVDGNRITLLDFDVANHHWFINDIAIACQSILIFQSGGLNGPVRDRTKLIAFLESFMEGYELENHLSSEWLSRLDLFINYRRMLLFTVLNNWIKSQPGLFDSWKGMILSPPELVGDYFGAETGY